MFKFSDSSLKKLNTCHPDLVKVMMVAIELSDIDFTIVYGRRSIKEQQALYAQGRTTPGSIVTNCDGVIHKSKHNATLELYFGDKEAIDHKSEAVDIAAYVNGKISWKPTELCYIAGVVDIVAKMLYKEGEITHKIKWGGNWDGDGEIITDQTLIDLPHYQIIK